ncbi:MAG TPA: hypothetical protein VKN76_09830 [Kiloniellaceae bacterium]|nr:hypothetical protein [Kiloniellaceae bacterium]
MTQFSKNAETGPHPWMWPFVEFAIVLGLCLVVLFVVIPAGTAESDNFGLSPRMLPIVTIATIAAVSFATFAADLLRRRPRGPSVGGRPWGVVLLLLATFAGVLSIDRFGIVMGGTILVVLASLAVGERRPLVVGGMGIAASIVLLFVEWSGL